MTKRVRKQAFSLFEVLLSLVIVGFISALTATKVMAWKNDTAFANDQKAINGLLLDAQTITILTDTTSEVVLKKESEGAWKATIDFSLPPHPLLAHINRHTTHTLSSIRTIQKKDSGEIRIALYPHLGEPSCGLIEIVSCEGKVKTCGESLERIVHETNRPIITDEILHSLEKTT